MEVIYCLIFFTKLGDSEGKDAGGVGGVGFAGNGDFA